MPSIYEKSTFSTGLPVRCARMNGTESYMYHWHKDTEIICGIRGVICFDAEYFFDIGKSHTNPLCQVPKDSNQWQASDRQNLLTDTLFKKLNH